MPVSSEPISFGRRLSELAGAEPARIVLTFIGADGSGSEWTTVALNRFANRIARQLSSRGAGSGSLVVIALPNCPEHVATAIAVWKLGGCVLPLSSRMPELERNALLEIMEPTVVVADWVDTAGRVSVGRSALLAQGGDATDPVPDRISRPGKAVASGGSTGRPKIIVDPAPWAQRPGELARAFAPLGFRSGQRQLLAGPLYHNAPFLWMHYGLFEAGSVVLMERFDAEQAVSLIESERIEWVMMVPTMMGRIARLPRLDKGSLSSLEAVYHTAGPCPPWVKRAWIELVGAGRVTEAYGSTENVGATVIRGDEWLAHPGSVGRPFGCDVRILGEQQEALPAGEVGEIYSRPQAADPFQYRGGTTIRSTRDGFLSVGDLGWLDADGYLYLADRRTDLIVTGGANVYPKEVEAALTEHPGVADAAVVGIPDPDFGKRVHAVVQPAAGRTLSVAELDAHCRVRLSPYKVPRSFELVAELPRNEAGKLRRDGLIRERGS